MTQLVGQVSPRTAAETAPDWKRCGNTNSHDSTPYGLSIESWWHARNYYGDRKKGGGGHFSGIAGYPLS